MGVLCSTKPRTKTGTDVMARLNMLRNNELYKLFFLKISSKFNINKINFKLTPVENAFQKA